mgnify:CR=1 FL=1
MRVRWSRVFAVLLTVFAIALFIHEKEAISAFFSSMRNFGPGHSPDDQFAGVIASVVVLTTIVALARILSSENRDQ